MCHRLGIVNKGEEITETAPDIVISTLRALFRMDCDFASVLEQALVDHDGQGGA
jgi:hypothetical protein